MKYILSILLIVLTFTVSAQRVYNDTKQHQFKTVPFQKDSLKGNCKTKIKINGVSKDILLVDKKIYKNQKCFHGVIDGDKNSLVALSVDNGQINGTIFRSDGNYSVKNGRVIKDQVDTFKCLTPDKAIPIEASELTTCKIVKLSVTADYKTFLDKGSSVANVKSFLISSIYNNIAVLYANEGITIEVDSITVLTSPTPKYDTCKSTGALLEAFRKQPFTGNVAQFVTTRVMGGGIAYVDVLCNKAYAYSVIANVSTTNSAYPNYSWNVHSGGHELGHMLGSPHTHSCNWVGGALDDCYTPEGTCPCGAHPTNGGTIMSYCHINSPCSGQTVGVNLANGFGQQPGDLIRARVNGSSCLTGNGTIPTNPQSAPSTTIVQLKWDSVGTSYIVQYRKSTVSTWTSVAASSNNILISGLTAGTLYYWQVKSGCSDYTSQQSFTTLTTTTTCNAATGLSGVRINRTTANLSWSNVSGASSYTINVYNSDNSLFKTVSSTTNTMSIGGLRRNRTYYFKVITKCGTTSSVSSIASTTF